MKKIISLLMCIMLILAYFSGCNQAATDNPNTTEPLNEFQKLVETAKEGEYEEFNGERYDWGCAKLEESLERVTDIVKATYITTKQVYPDYLHIFEVFENVRGTKTPKTIYVRGEVNAFEGHSTREISYKNGKNYLLLLKRYTTQYLESEQFDLVDGMLIIPLDTKNLPDIANSKICNYTLMSYAEENIKSEELKASISSGTFLDEILKITESNPYIFEGDFINSEDLHTILNKSEYVLMIKLEYVSRREDAFGCYYRRKYRCTVLDDIKGNFPDELEEKGIAVWLPTSNFDTKERRYIVAAQTFLFSGVVEISSRNSIHSVLEEDNFRAILESYENKE